MIALLFLLILGVKVVTFSKSKLDFISRFSTESGCPLNAAHLLLSLHEKTVYYLNELPSNLNQNYLQNNSMKLCNKTKEVDEWVLLVGRQEGLEALLFLQGKKVPPLLQGHTFREILDTLLIYIVKSR